MKVLLRGGRVAERVVQTRDPAVRFAVTRRHCQARLKRLERAPVIAHSCERHAEMKMRGGEEVQTLH